MRRVDTEMLAKVNTKTLAVEISAGAQHDGAGAGFARDIRERIGRVGHDDQYRPRRRLDDLRNDIAIDFRVLVQQFQTALRIVAVGGAAGLLVHARGDQHHIGALEAAIVAVSDFDLAAERDAVSDVGRHRLGGFSGAVDQDNLVRAAAHGGCHRAGAADTSCSDDADLRWLLHAKPSSTSTGIPKGRRTEQGDNGPCLNDVNQREQDHCNECQLDDVQRTAIRLCNSLEGRRNP